MAGTLKDRVSRQLAIIVGLASSSRLCTLHASFTVSDGVGSACSVGLRRWSSWFAVDCLPLSSVQLKMLLRPSWWPVPRWTLENPTSRGSITPAETDWIGGPAWRVPDVCVGGQHRRCDDVRTRRQMTAMKLNDAPTTMMTQLTGNSSSLTAT